MRRLIVFALLTFVLGDQTNKSAAEQQADFAKTIVGVWRAVASVDESSASPSERPHQPAIYIFTARHYSIQSINGAEPRPDVPPNLPDTERKLAIYEHWLRFTAHSGTYEVQGSRMTTTPIVAKNNRVMTALGVEHWNIRLEGEALWLTNVTPQYRVKLVRME
jgi:hypothetical protein